MMNYRSLPRQRTLAREQWRPGNRSRVRKRIDARARKAAQLNRQRPRLTDKTDCRRPKVLSFEIYYRYGCVRTGAETPPGSTGEKDHSKRTAAEMSSVKLLP